MKYDIGGLIIDRDNTIGLITGYNPDKDTYTIDWQGNEFTKGHYFAYEEYYIDKWITIKDYKYYPAK
jgi:hypothetical protein